MAQKIKLINGYEWYKSPDNVSITELCGSLGIDIYNGNKIQCPCPDHNDKNPSTMVNDHGKFANTWKCWSCGESGGPVELVLAAKYGIKPSEYFQVMRTGSKENRQEMAKYYKKAAMDIDKEFPGNIKVIDGKEEIPEMVEPTLPKWIEKNLELPRFFEVAHIIPWEEGKLNKHDLKTRKTEKLSEIEKVDLKLGKLAELQKNLVNFKDKIFELYPMFHDNPEARQDIETATLTKIIEIDDCIDRYNEYLNYLEEKSKESPDYESPFNWQSEEKLKDVAEYMGDLDKESEMER